MSRPIVTRSQTREQEASPSTYSHSDPCSYFEDVEGDETAFQSFTSGSHRSPCTSTPAAQCQHTCSTGTNTDDEGKADDMVQPPPPNPPNPNPTPPAPKAPGLPGDSGPLGGPPGGSNNGGGNDPLGSNGDEDNDARGERMFLQLTQAIADLARSTCTVHQPLPPPDPLRRTKVCEPDQFDGSDTHKLCTFFVQCELNFQDCPHAFATDAMKVVFTLSYLKGVALDWFEPDLLCGPQAHRSPWMDDYSEFVFELERNFGPHDPVSDAEHLLASLSMKDSQQINWYIVEFNRHASQVRGYGEGALRYHFYNGLPNRIKDEI